MPTLRPSFGITRLPPELLALVFELGALPALVDPDLGGSPREPGPWEIRVSHVCRRWREVALKTTVLWSSIAFHHFTHIERAREYISRSQKRPLSILIETVNKDRHVPGTTLCIQEFDGIFEIIVPHVHRWRSFVLRVRDRECKAKAKVHLSTCGPANQLEFMELTHLEAWNTAQDWHYSMVQPAVLVFDGIIPRLKGLTLVGVNLPWEDSKFLRGLEKLELALHMDNVRPSYAEWYKILTGSPDLKTLSLLYAGPSTRSDWPPEPIQLMNLTELSLSEMEPEYLQNVIEHLSTPSVTRFRLDLGDTKVFTDFICSVTPPRTSHFARLQSLHISSLKCDARVWERFLTSLTQLRFLFIDFSRVDDVFLQPLLACNRSSERLTTTNKPLCCPDLSVVKLNGLPSSSLITLDQKRRCYGCPLEKICLSERDRDMLESDLEGGKIGCEVVWFFEEEEEADGDEQIYSDDDEEEGEGEGEENGAEGDLMEDNEDHN